MSSLDTAPTGHTLRLLTLPSAWSGFMETNTTGTSCLGPLIHLLHVSDSADLPEDWLQRIGAGSTLQNEIDAAGKQRLEEFATSLPLEGRPLQAHHSSGTQWREVTSTAQSVGADLIVLGTVGRSGVKGLLLGNTTEKVLSTCECSILVVKPADFVSPLADSSGTTTS